MEYVMGIKGKDFVMVCTSATAVQQIITMKHDEDKILPLDSHSLLVGFSPFTCIQGAKRFPSKEAEREREKERRMNK